MALRPASGSTSTVDLLVRGRRAVAAQAWRDAYRDLSTVDRSTALEAADLASLATVAHLVGEDDAAGEAFARAHEAFLRQDDVGPAVRCAFWHALLLMQAGRPAEAGGWIARSYHLLEDAGTQPPERAYLLVPGALQALFRGRPAEADALFARVAATGDRAGDPDLVALGQLGRGQAAARLGRLARAAALLDEAMLAVTTGDVSVLAAGTVYCSVILACREMFDLRRAEEWTAALSRWCATQQDLRPYRGQCLVHRSEVLQLRGDWDAALEQVRAASAHLSSHEPVDPALGMAQYQRAELLRLRGQFAAAERAYRQASTRGHPVQPGLALLRLAQGRTEIAAAAIRTAADDAGNDRVQRSRLLTALVEISLAAGDVETARDGADALTRLAAGFPVPYLRAAAAGARGAVLLADGDARAACTVLRQAWRVWQELDAPYEAARARLMVARACRRTGDQDTVELELDAARQVFARLGAVTALREVAALEGPGDGGDPAPLTRREIDVLRVVTTGATNREVAASLVISEKTVARHLDNIYTKLGLSSRAAATAYAYEHQLVP